MKFTDMCIVSGSISQLFGVSEKLNELPGRGGPIYVSNMQNQEPLLLLLSAEQFIVIIPPVKLQTP